MMQSPLFDFQEQATKSAQHQAEFSEIMPLCHLAAERVAVPVSSLVRDRNLTAWQAMPAPC
jgi:hypothetical protein